MTGLTTGLAVGLRLRTDGDFWEVVGLDGRSVLLEGTGGRLRQVGVGHLLGREDLELLVPEAAAPESTASEDLSGLDRGQSAELAERVAHVREVLTGFRSGSAEVALPGEPRPPYAPGTSLMDCYRAKADELGHGESTVRRWVEAYRKRGPAGCADGRHTRRRDPLGGVDARWLDTLRAVLAEHKAASRPTKAGLLDIVGSRLDEEYGAGVVPVPGRTRQLEVLRELERGTNDFSGSTKGKRSIANRPRTSYGRFRTSRPGEALVLDTNDLDVFAMDPTTLAWVRVQLTVAMDAYSRCIMGLRCTPGSTKAVDVGAVLLEAIRPGPDTDGGLPYAGLPSRVTLDPDKLVDGSGNALLPSAAVESIVVDHGKVFLSELVESACAEFGISVEPARPYQPTDKPVERWFRTLGESLLSRLEGYKGPDVYGRGLDVEQRSFYFLNEIEQIIREWNVCYYHQRPHRGLVVPEVPGLPMTPIQMLEHGITRAGLLRIPARPDMVYAFMPTVWRQINHYGVEAFKLVYDSPALDRHRDRDSTYGGAHAGLWPLRYDPSDASRMYFREPQDGRWHPVPWNRAAELNQPFSLDALRYARALAASQRRHVDDVAALRSLLSRWAADGTRGAAERRMAYRLSEQRLHLLPDGVPDAAEAPPPPEPPAGLHGEDDAEDERDAPAPDDYLDEGGDALATFYDDTLDIG